MKTIRTLKTHTAIPIAAVAFLLLGGVALHIQGATPAVAQTGGPGPAPWYAVGQGTVSGGSYSLTSPSWRVSGTAGGGAYRLTSPDQPSLRGNGCCCTFLPLVLRNK
jgi:hypothetical protein